MWVIVCVHVSPSFTSPFFNTHTHPQWVSLDPYKSQGNYIGILFPWHPFPAVELWGHFLFRGKRGDVEARKWAEKTEKYSDECRSLLSLALTFSFPTQWERKSSFRQLMHTHTHCQVQQPLLVTPWHCSQRTHTHTPACLEQESFWGTAVKWMHKCVCCVCVCQFLILNWT